MYMNRLSYHRMSSNGSNANADSTGQKHGLPMIETSCLPKRKEPSPTSPASLSSPRVGGDFQMLYTTVSEHRDSVRKARAALASSLDRLGEHHVRRKEYDAAMDAFTEALHEKRSIYTNAVAALNRNAGVGNTFFSSSSDDSSQVHDEAIDEIIITLRNMGNVHSLRGEQDEAMRYYSEVTNLSAIKTTSNVDGDDTSTLFSGLVGEEDNSTLMSEINEDVKALDDMFRSISFRNNDNTSMWRRDKSLSKSLSNSSRSKEAPFPPSSKRRKSNFGQANVPMWTEGEPFRRSSSATFAGSTNQITEALETFKSVLDNFSGDSLEVYRENYNSLALRTDLLAESASRPDTPSDGKGGAPIDLQLLLDIYQHILKVQKEQQALESASCQETSMQIASTLIRMGSVYYKLGNRLEELSMYKEAKDVYSRAFGENHAYVAGAKKNIGMVLAERGEYEEAMAEFDEARKIYLAANDESDLSRDVASAISCMGNVKNRTGDLAEALAHYMDALKIYKALCEKADDPANIESTEKISSSVLDVTATLKVIGMVHAKQGQLDTATTFFTEAMDLLRSSGIDDTAAGSETIASLLTRIASIHVKKGDLTEAMEHYRQAYELIIQAKGTTNHQDVAGILHYIGGILHKQSDYDEAMNCYQEAIRIYHSTLGPGNPTVAGTLVMVGSIHYKRRNLDSAMMFYREALRLNRDAYGLHHPDVAPILKSIGTILTKTGDFRGAYEVFRDVLSIKCTIYGTCHPEVASAYKSLGNVHYKLGELADAERQYRHALSIYRRARGNEHPDTVAARTTIEHIRYWMKEKGLRRSSEGRHTRNSSRAQAQDDERSC
ncbi:hypothetical protein FisN_2Hh206 [Fistulifera solaris]|uniref:Kinesin light chain n=1 Tax=Fistulifera solaris TaxID=1519565 RepID=A0A1Z5KJF0_FISSO|nr:hypothetical protein FisN_2Hh206 [Fistulifera solaris]|eukprot:GAX26376.1 hypothetical protein FisN_2Hh206 [Fistulifera solaris]